MNEAKIFLHFALSDKNEDEKLQKLIKSCKIISDMLPNDKLNPSVRESLSEILPKMIKMLPTLTPTIDRIISACIEKFVDCDEIASFFYKTFVEEFHQATISLIKEKCSRYILILCQQLEKAQLKSLQKSLENYLKAAWFQDKKNRSHAIEIAEYLYKRLRSKISDWIFNEFLEDPNLKLLKFTQATSSKPSKSSRSFQTESEGGSFISEFQDEAEEMKFNIDDLKSALKTESKIDKIESAMNHEDICIDTNKYLKSFLSRKENLEIFISLISRPHDVDSRIMWRLNDRISLAQPGVFEDYREFNLQNNKKYYLYDHNRMSSIEYVNKQIELKNIFRSYLAVQILLHERNLQFVLNSLPDSFDRIIKKLREGLEPKHNACLFHILCLLKAMKMTNIERFTTSIIENKLMTLMLQVFENKNIQCFIFELLTNNSKLQTIVQSDRLVQELVREQFFDILLDLMQFNRNRYDRAMLQIIYELTNIPQDNSPQKTDKKNEMSMSFQQASFDKNKNQDSFGTGGDNTEANLFKTKTQQQEEKLNLPDGMTVQTPYQIFNIMTNIFDVTDYQKKYYENSGFIRKGNYHLLKYITRSESDMLLLNATINNFLRFTFDPDHEDFGYDNGKLLLRVLNYLETYIIDDNDIEKIGQIMKSNFIEFQKLLIQVLKQQINGKYQSIKLQGYQSEMRCSGLGLLCIEILLKILNHDRSYIIYISKEAWMHLVDSFFYFKFSTMYQHIFFKLLVHAINHESEKVLISIFITQNTVAQLLNVFQERQQALIYGRSFQSDHQFYLVKQWVRWLELYEFNDNYPLLQQQLSSSYSWKRIKEIRRELPIEIQESGECFSEKYTITCDLSPPIRSSVRIFTEDQEQFAGLDVRSTGSRRSTRLTQKSGTLMSKKTTKRESNMLSPNKKSTFGDNNAMMTVTISTPESGDSTKMQKFATKKSKI